MPDRLSYDEAMLYAQHTLKIQEPDLKQGKVETYAVNTKAGPLQKPWGREGGFAVVYKFRTQSGQMKAMRCFRAAMSQDIEARYTLMSSFFRQHLPEITIDFHYYSDGILVKESAQASQKKVCPVIVMEWIEGATLLDTVDELCKRRDRHALGQLAEQWLNMLAQMRAAHMAHGDLAAVNIMVRPNGRMVLIDYDGVYLPEFASMAQVLLGQNGYQHPDMANRPFNESMDDFSALVIYLSLLALQHQPELWAKHTRRNASGQLDGMMLFTGDDFAQPDTSLIFYELFRSGDTRIRDLAHRLMDCCKQPVDQVRFPLDLLDPDHATRLLLRQLEDAIQANQDELILQLWQEPLASYAPAQVYRARIDEARQHEAALVALRSALAGQDIAHIAHAASSVSPGRLKQQEGMLALLASNFMRAYHSDDDDAILNCWQEIEYSSCQTLLRLAPPQQQRLELARQRKSALTRFRVACMQSRNAHEIVNAYSSLLDGSSAISIQEHALLQRAREYIVMYDAVKSALYTRDLARLHEVYDEELDQRFNDFTGQERVQIAALKNMGKLERALQGRAYRLALETAREIETQTRIPLNDTRLSVARMNFIRAFEPRNLQVSVQGSQAFAHWDWPTDELVQFAVLVWRSDRWPLHPRKDDPGRILLRVNRGFYEQYTYFSFPIGEAGQIYVQVFFAISEVIEQTFEQQWFYSRGTELTSKWSTLLRS